MSKMGPGGAPVHHTLTKRKQKKAKNEKKKKDSMSEKERKEGPDEKKNKARES